MAVPGSNEGASGRRTAGEGDSPGHDDTPSDFATLYTVGHSTRALETLIGLLAGFGIEMLVDVRTIPRSRRLPHFNPEALRASLEHAGIGYEHEPALGGLRKPAPDSINTGWKIAGFRGYADHMQTLEFERALGELITMGRSHRTAIMCAEAVPWRCHRSLIADALVIRGVHVIHILDEHVSRSHQMTPWAQVEGLEITYPAKP